MKMRSFWLNLRLVCASATGDGGQTMLTLLTGDEKKSIGKTNQGAKKQLPDVTIDVPVSATSPINASSEGGDIPEIEKKAAAGRGMP